ncbi:MOSC domain-containing protein [Thaumasiovibrio subtropicus]|uniref:MOSC domain-containing protein n=1 Tax=Thaumasiovibrio subtropicus TaxID=1891207 RepID=UPI000B358EA4|nr:MOSC domain-containing protein [Thaumasiovibrio subtropicus]
MSSTITLFGVYRGKVMQSFGMETAINKQGVKERLYLSELGLEGDECADKKHHGGPDRALHQYPREHYAYWQARFPDISGWQAPGMGENLSTEGMTEETVCIGDRYQWGDAIVEVSQPRSPCLTLNKRWGVEAISVEMQNISRCGWLYRVIQPGWVSVDAPLSLIERTDNAMTVKAVCDLFFGDPLNQDGLKQLQTQQRLSRSWMDKVDKRLQTGDVENWNFRLFGHP